jgi:signal transduction histidine kinase
VSAARQVRQLVRSAAVLVAAAAAASGVVGLAFGVHGMLLTLGLLSAVGAAALAVAHAAAARRRRLGRLSRQFTLAVGIAVGQMLVAAALVAVMMFVSHHDALMTIVIAAFAGAIAVRAAQLFAGGVLNDVEAVRDGLSAVGEGQRAVRIRTEAGDEVAELAERANAMVERLAAEEAARDGAESARRHLIAAVSHDLRTPITSLRLLAEAVSDDIVDEATRRRYLDTMTTHINALAALIDDLFELSRLEAGEIEWSMERVRLDDLVGETVAAMRPAAEAKRVAVVAEVSGDLEAARANPEGVQRVLFNLIQNAIRHTPADGSVTVRAQSGVAGPEIEVADTGEGIAPGERERVFDAFYRGGSEAARTRNGTGLGLAISRAIVEAHGGRIWLEPAAPGTRVRFTLPRA